MRQSDRYRSRKSDGAAEGVRTPLWASALTAELLVLGFAREAAPGRSPSRRHVPARDHGRGRLASTPVEIPAQDRIVLVAAGVTFYSLLAIFLAIAALVAVYGLFADPSQIALVDNFAGVSA